MQRLSSRGVIGLLILAAMVIQPVPRAAAAQPPSRNQNTKRSGKGASPDSLINSDGSLRLDGSFSGALDLSGYDVQLDPARGPLFTEHATQPAAPLASAGLGQWAAMGGGSGALNGSVWAAAVMGGDVYVGGDFTDAANNSEADRIAMWDGSSWHNVGAATSGGGSFSGSVYALAVDGSVLYVGGSFCGVLNGVTSIPEACLLAKWDGSDWSAVGNGGVGVAAISVGNVTSLAVDSSHNLYAGGAFTSVKDSSGNPIPEAQFVAKWNGSAWSALGSNGSGGPSLNSAVNALAVIGTDIYVGGYFSDVNNNGAVIGAADYVAKWDGSNWSALGSNGAGNGSLNTTVRALAVSGTNLYVGGDFVNVNNNGASLNAADYVALWNGSNWSALGGDGSGGGSIENFTGVNALFVSGSDLYVGGGFSYVNDGGIVRNAADYIARWDGTHWLALGNDGAGEGALKDGYVRAIAVNGTDVFGGGTFQSINDGGTYYPGGDFIGRWNGSDWFPVGIQQGAINNTVVTVVVQGPDVYVGGDFINAGNVAAADYIARWDGSWHALGDNGSGDGCLDASVSAIAVSGSDAYVGGSFSNVKQNSSTIGEADYIARWDGTNWHGLGGNGAGGSSISGLPYVIQTHGSDVYVGGYFNDVNNGGTVLTAADYIAKWDGSNWSALGGNGSGNGSLNNVVQDIAIIGSDVYAGGSFYDVNDNGTALTGADFVARWDGADWHSLSDDGALTPDGSLSNIVDALATDGTNLYAGGRFYNVNNAGTILDAADHIARWDGSNWSALGNNGSGDGSLSNVVEDILVRGTDVYVAGDFTDVKNSDGNTVNEADYVAKWDGSAWSALGSDGSGDGSISQPLYPSARTLAGGASELFVGGDFFNVNNGGSVLGFADHVARYGIPPLITDAVDFEGDEFSELSYFRASTGEWGVLKSSKNFSYANAQFFSWGQTGDIAVAGDYDGDGLNDPTIRRPPAASQSAAYVSLLSSTGYNFASPLIIPAGWPGLGDTPVPADYNGDGIYDPAIFRSNTAVWIIPLSPTFSSYAFYSWGAAGDTPVSGDVDGDGTSDIGYYHAANGTWGFLLSGQSFSYGSPQFFSWGSSTDAPYMRDYDGDGLADPTYVTPPANSQSAAYRILLSSTGYDYGQSLTIPAGWPGLQDKPVPNDYDGDGKADAGIWRGNTGIWIIPKSSTNNASYLYASWGASGDMPLK